jgi:putative hydrolase of HD superfamily
MSVDDQHDSSPGDTLEALLDLGALDALPRTGWLLRGVQPAESVAGHLLGVAHMALALAPRVDLPLDLGRVLAMAVLHDAAEARSGDIPGPAGSLLAPGQKHALESSLADDLLTPLSATARGAFEEYLTQESREARFIKACDRLQLGVRLVGYERAGWRGLDEFWDGLDPELFAEFAPCQDLCAELLRSRQGVS